MQRSRAHGSGFYVPYNPPPYINPPTPLPFHIPNILQYTTMGIFDRGVEVLDTLNPRPKYQGRGSVQWPKFGQAEIVLWGDEESITVIMAEGLFLVNKAVSRR